MLFFKALHLISLVAWFAGLFYLPRLFVYHVDALDEVSNKRFKTMERRLYYAIMWPAAIATTVFGMTLFTYNMPYYMKAGWMHSKLLLVFLLWVFHFTCGHFVKQFASDKNKKSTKFYRIFNELPTVLLISIVMLAVVKPF